MFGDYTDEDAVSPGRALGRRQEAEIAMYAAYRRASARFRSDVERTVLARSVVPQQLTQGLADGLWITAVDNSLERLRSTDEAREYAREQMALSEIPSFTHDVLDAIAEHVGKAGLSVELHRELVQRALFPDDDDSVALTASLQAAGWDDVLAPDRSKASAIDAILDAPRPEPGSIERPWWLPEAKDWEWRNARDSRTAATEWQARQAERRLRSLGRKQKQWVTRHDARVRPDHALADRQIVRIDEMFDVGGVPMRYPGDTSAPIELWINCRCVLVAAPPGRPRTRR